MNIVFGLIGDCCGCPCHADSKEVIALKRLCVIVKEGFLARGRDRNYFSNLKRACDAYKNMYERPRLDTLGLPRQAVADMTKLLELYALVRADTKKIEEGCKRALSAGIPFAIVDEIVGAKCTIDHLDKEGATRKFQAYVGCVSESCTICLVGLEKADLIAKQVIQTPCKHFFHTTCLDEWVKVKELCPVCKTAFNATANKKQWLSYLDRINVQLLSFLGGGDTSKDEEIARALQADFDRETHQT